MGLDRNNNAFRYLLLRAHCVFDSWHVAKNDVLPDR